MRMIGLMSGTSLDGVDAVMADFDASGHPRPCGHLHSPYSAELATALRNINADSPLAHLLALDARLAGVYAAAVESLLHATGCTRRQVSAIALHGQTLWHAPLADPPVTCQAGDPSRLAEATGLPVVADFRQRDLAAGGVGAPLAPVFHAALLGGEQRRCVVNVGGVANLSVLAAGGRAEAGFDTGPGNALMDAGARRYLDSAFDRDGAWAASGQVDSAFLDRLLADPYFQRPPPKSLDVSTFDPHWLDAHAGQPAQPVDRQATLLALTAETIAAAVERWGGGPRDVVITGGGAANTALCRALDHRLGGERPLKTSDELGIPALQVEALGFAWLGRATLLGEPVDLTAITGARRPTVLGGIYPA
ncbi:MULTISPECIES: anhydro-N-acetylmuramic acid kinase [Spiribacter]|uniref:Anhydro-N-acetylmuramic acid kinase n=1 Tax=Spiribacter roseus TaxID=1855875 RepID=A0ABV3RUP6_9GAMM|nr:anhydro-N-acetylmuramic acid kinase [Spiribacter roseus]KAF0284537.1 anhydro-N-acetylmuramic acid kinase [Spiribacter roseus]KAF0286623.1 anhydro-N-acetylmuramic acid kinase [Spiribacter sp. SSL99]